MPAQRRAALQRHIRTIPDWPEAGVLFRDITPLLQDRAAFGALIDHFAERYDDAGIDYVAGIDARGFIVGGAVAYRLETGFIPVRKKGKLPYATVAEDYTLEYGAASVEIHTDACRPGARILLIDDLVATGGTLLASARLLQRLGAEVVEAAAIVDLPELGGSARVREAGIPLYAVCEFGRTSGSAR